MIGKAAFWPSASSALSGVAIQIQDADVLLPLSCADPEPPPLAHQHLWNACPCCQANFHQQALKSLQPGYVGKLLMRGFTNFCQLQPENFSTGSCAHASTACTMRIWKAPGPQVCPGRTAELQRGPLALLSKAAGKSGVSCWTLWSLPCCREEKCTMWPDHNALSPESIKGNWIQSLSVFTALQKTTVTSLAGRDSPPDLTRDACCSARSL